MLTKIEKINNIGSIADVKKIPESYDFKEINIFYGLNGSGKTTFTAILKSLRDNDLNILKGRKSLLNNDDSEIEFKFDKDRIGFKKKWLFNSSDLQDDQKPKILIFDDEFIKNNIFAEDFEIGHKKSIHKIIFGVDGVTLSRGLVELRGKKKKLEIEKDILFSKIIPSFYSRTDYLNIDIAKLDKNELTKKEGDVDKKIGEVENLNTIKLKPGFEKVSVSDFDFVKTDDFWEYNIDSKAHTEAKQQVENFKKEYFKNIFDAETFIRSGLANIGENKSCPFCHNQVNDNILDLYREYFNDSYDKWTAKIVGYKNELTNWNLSTMGAVVTAVINRNDTQFNYWKEKKDSLIQCQVELGNCFEELIKIKNDGLELITKKINDPSQVIDKHLIHRLNASKDNQLNLIKSYNEWVDSQNNYITEYKKDLEKKDSSSLQRERGEIVDKLSRLSTVEIEKCENFKNAELKLKDSVLEIEKGVKALNDYTELIIVKYINLINDNLKRFGCRNFEVSKFINKTNENASDPYVEIVLKIINKEISMSNGKHDEHSFKNTLSKGEKNSLAFAFFLAFFEEEIKDKQDYILVFDDPLTSNDDNREDDTASEIKKLSNKVKQIIVLTHKLSFLQRLYCKFGKTPTYIMVEKHSNKTVFKEQDIDELFLENYKKIINRFEDILADGIGGGLREDDLCKDIRQIFEHVLWSKYYDLIRRNNDVISGRKQLINTQALDDIFFSKGYLTEIKDDFLDLCKIGNESSHNNDNQLNSEQVKTKISKTLDIIKKL